MNLPIEFEKKMKAFLGDEWDDFLYSYDNNRFQALRFNTLKVQSHEEIMRILMVLEISSDKRVSWANEAYYFDENVRPGKMCIRDRDRILGIFPVGIFIFIIIFFDEPCNIFIYAVHVFVH